MKNNCKYGCLDSKRQKLKDLIHVLQLFVHNDKSKRDDFFLKCNLKKNQKYPVQLMVKIFQH